MMGIEGHSVAVQSSDTILLLTDLLVLINILANWSVTDVPY